MNPEIIYADENIVVVNKPAGLAAHRGESVRGKTLADFLLEKFPEIRGVGDDAENRPGIVHRLDKNTSGVMAAARSKAGFVFLKELFKERMVEKVYVAVVCGKMKAGQGVISLPLGRLVKNPLKRGVVEGRSRVRGAKEAETEYKVLKAADKYSLVELRPKTGRMHQLRAHLKAIGHPVACDKLYGGRNVCCPAGVSRHLLHAKSISFSPERGKKMRFEAEEPADFKFALNKIFC